MALSNSPVAVELVYDRDCPNLERARATIRAALHEVGSDPPAWTEWDRESIDTPADRRRFASPTVLVNGRDVGSDESDLVASDANACRIYVDANGRLSGAPSSRAIVNAILASRAAGSRANLSGPPSAER